MRATLHSIPTPISDETGWNYKSLFILSQQLHYSHRVRPPELNFQLHFCTLRQIAERKFRSIMSHFTSRHKTAFMSTKRLIVDRFWFGPLTATKPPLHHMNSNPVQVTGQKHIQPLWSHGLGEQKVCGSSQVKGKCWLHLRPMVTLFESWQTLKPFIFFFNNQTDVVNCCNHARRGRTEKLRADNRTHTMSEERRKD